MLGADILLHCLEAQGVDVVFGLPGGTVIPLYDRLKEFPNIKHILTKHEQGAAHAADGYSRATGKVGVCFATSGPGATNLVTGIATANMDSIPMVCIMGQVVRELLGTDGFQEAHMAGVCQPICKHVYAVKDASELPDIVTEAFYVAKTGRPGPVVIDIPKDIFSQDCMIPFDSGKVRNRVMMKMKPCSVSKEQVMRAAELLEKAEKPLMIIGGGVNNRDENQSLIYEIAQKLHMPVTSTLMAQGVFPHHNPYDLGMPGMHGTVVANYAIQHSDCIIAVGMRFDDRVTSVVKSFAPNAKHIIHVDVDPAEIGKTVTSNFPIVADSYDFLMALSDVAKQAKHDAWIEEIQANRLDLQSPAGSVLPPKEVFEFVDRAVNDNTVVVTDVGQHQMWAALFMTPKKPRNFVTSGGLGTMGFGFPAAIGAQFARPKDRVILITGDGSFQMCMQELAVMRKFKLPIKICLMNNGYLGMVHQWQKMFFDKNYAETTLDVGPDWDKLADAYGLKYRRIDRLEECDDDLLQALQDDQGWLIDFRIDAEANVYPMVPGGKSLDDIVIGGDYE